MIALLILLIASTCGITRSVDPDLTAIAAQRAIEVQTDWSHDGKPDGVAEVLAYNSGLIDPATEAMNQWRESPEHWAILSSDVYTRIGCASAPAGDGVTTYFVCILAWDEAVASLVQPPQAPRVGEIPDKPMLLPDTDQGASSATSGTIPPQRQPPANLFFIAAAFMLGALALLFVVRLRASQGMPTCL